MKRDENEQLEDILPAVSQLPQSIVGLLALIGHSVSQGHELAREHIDAACRASLSNSDDAKRKAHTALEVAVAGAHEQLLLYADVLLPMYCGPGAPSREIIHEVLCEALLVGFRAFNDMLHAAALGCMELSPCPGRFMDPRWICETSEDLLDALLERLATLRIPVPGATKFKEGRRLLHTPPHRREGGAQ